MTTRSIAASTFWQIASQGIMAALSVVTSKFVTVALTTELAGHYNSAYGYLQIFAVLADFGLYAVAVREVSRAQDRARVLGTLMVVRAAILTLSMGLAVGTVWLLPQWRGTPFPMGVAIAAFVPTFTLLAGMLRTVFQVEYKMHFVFVAETLQRVVTTALIGLFVWTGYRNSGEVWLYEAFLWIGGIGAGVLFAVSAVYASRLIPLRPTFDRALIRRVFLLAAPYGVAYLCMALFRQTSVVFIAMLRPDFALQNAYWGIPMRVVDMAFIIPTFLLNSLLPILTERQARGEESRELLGKTLVVILLSGAVLLLFSLFWARPLTLLLSTPAYLSAPGRPGSDQAFQLASVLMLFNGPVLYGFYVMLARDAWRRLTATLAAGAALSVVLNLLWVPSYGFVGAAAALLVVHGLLTAVLLPQAVRMMPVRVTRAQVRAFLAIVLPLAPALWLSAPLLTTMPRILAGCALSVVAMAGLAWAGGLRSAVRE